MVIENGDLILYDGIYRSSNDDQKVIGVNEA